MLRGVLFVALLGMAVAGGYYRGRSVGLQPNRQNTLNFACGAQGADGSLGPAVSQPYSYSFSGAPSWLTPSGSSLSGTPPSGQFGPWYITVNYFGPQSGSSDIALMVSPNSGSPSAGGASPFGGSSPSGGYSLGGSFPGFGSNSGSPGSVYTSSLPGIGTATLSGTGSGSYVTLTGVGAGVYPAGTPAGNVLYNTSSSSSSYSNNNGNTNSYVQNKATRVIQGGAGAGYAAYTQTIRTTTVTYTESDSGYNILVPIINTTVVPQVTPAKLVVTPAVNCSDQDAAAMSINSNLTYQLLDINSIKGRIADLQRLIDSLNNQLSPLQLQYATDQARAITINAALDACRQQAAAVPPPTIVPGTVVPTTVTTTSYITKSGV